jgi:hypothetical protein
MWLRSKSSDRSSAELPNGLPACKGCQQKWAASRNGLASVQGLISPTFSGNASMATNYCLSDDFNLR